MPRDHSGDGPTVDQEEAPRFLTDPIGDARRDTPIAGGPPAGLPDSPDEGNMAVQNPTPFKTLR